MIIDDVLDKDLQIEIDDGCRWKFIFDTPHYNNEYYSLG
jgi:hypothetical protein